MHLGAQIGRECVNAAHAHAVQTARNLIGTFVKLTSRMKHGEHDLKSALVLLLVHVDGYASTVIDNRY